MINKEDNDKGFNHAHKRLDKLTNKTQQRDLRENSKTKDTDEDDEQ
ncbi:hypothetical protein [Vreelandella titanicae]|uniref:Uncharacterized protein n=1 Tax=Vreelandella titanicae TaxID=664683 RepID=A0AAP9NMF4_9GAMM|nr:hypothetical protein [Halomonas titanicae]QKS24607.1 hypothetical protein FX987_02389 [Halomonas titanicae]